MALLDKGNMKLLALNLQKPSAVNCAIYGNFSQPKTHEFVLAKGNIIELLRPDETGKLISICSTSVFSVVRSILPFRLAGGNRDYLIIGSDSGRLSICEFDIQSNNWTVLHAEVYGKTGCRRIVPGQFIAADPRGRALMVAALEKQKFVYVLNRDSSNKLTVSSPQEAHKLDTFCISLCGVDVGFENPLFAVIEMEHADVDNDSTGAACELVEKRLTYYEHDLGLNHVVRKWSEPISRTAFLLLTVPGGDEGPSGVLICGENWVSYKHQTHPEVRTALPRRSTLPVQRGTLIISGALQKRKDSFFYILQSEYGDLYKCVLVLDEENNKIVKDVVISLFDTIQLCNSLCIARSGLLFAASEFGNHALFQFLSIGDDENAVQSKRVADELNETLGDDASSAATIAPLFTPSPVLKNLSLADEINSLAPITDMVIENLSSNTKDMTPQIHCLCGRGNRSTLRVLRQGLAVTRNAESPLPGRPTAVWTVKEKPSDEFDKYIVVSFSNATLVLSIGDSVQEVTNSDFLTGVSTFYVGILSDGAKIQIHQYGIRHLKVGNKFSDWKTPGKRPIEKCTANSTQVVVTLSGGQIIYFELDTAGQLVETASLDLRKDICCVDVGETPEGRIKSPFLAVGCSDDTVQVLSLENADMLAQRSSMSVPARPESLCLVKMVREAVIGVSEAEVNALAKATMAAANTNLYLNVGLANGVLVRATVDSVAGSLTDSRQKFLGPKGVKLFRVTVGGSRGVLALSTRSWVMFMWKGRYFQSPLSFDTLEYASSFVSEQCAEGFVAIAGDKLSILTIDDLSTLFNQTSYPLKYTPRKCCVLKTNRCLAIIESDHNEFNDAEREKIDSALTKKVEVPVIKQEEGDEENEVRIPVRGPVPAFGGHWASCIRVFEPATGETKHIIHLTDNEAAFSICTCRINDEEFVMVGIGKGVNLHPLHCTAAFINVYRILGTELQLLHQTELESVPYAIAEFNGKVLVGVGKSLRLYEMGKRKLLRKCENKSFPSTIVKIMVNGERVYVGDMIESVHMVKFKRQDGSLVIFADDICPRYITSTCILDYDTVGGVDKFGNFFVLRLPANVNDNNYDNPAGNRVLWDQNAQGNAPNKLDMLAHYHLGEMGTAMCMTSLVLGGREAMIVGTVMGGIYAFLPFSAKEDADFFTHLEMFMRQEKSTLCQRDHMSYRSYYQPVSHVIDGDLCELLSSLSFKKQQEFANDVDRSTIEVLKKLDDVRNYLM